nr:MULTISPECIES: NotI family restriction endonuclease [unclassified Thermosynechococcus]
MSNGGQPEVFGYLVTDPTDAAQRYRSRRLCPFNNKVPNCTKDKAKNPLGVCSVYHEGTPVITCPIRFRQDWIVADAAADFFLKREHSGLLLRKCVSTMPMASLLETSMLFLLPMMKVAE